MIRPPARSDQSYIASTWARSMLSMHAHQRHLRSKTGQQIGRQIDQVLDRSDTRALICAKDNDPSHIFGWILYVQGPSVPVVHYLYTRRDNRGEGVAAALLAGIGVTRTNSVVCTSYGPSSESMRSRFKASVHVPLVDFLEPG